MNADKELRVELIEIAAPTASDATGEVTRTHFRTPAGRAVVEQLS